MRWNDEWNVFLTTLVSWEIWGKNEAFSTLLAGSQGRPFSWGRNKPIMSGLIVYFQNYLDDVANDTWRWHLLLLVINICLFKIAREWYKQNTSWSSTDSTLNRLVRSIPEPSRSQDRAIRTSTLQVNRGEGFFSFPLVYLLFLTDRLPYCLFAFVFRAFINSFNK